MGADSGEALVLLFALEELRSTFGYRGAPGADPRGDAGPFRAFREAILGAASGCARGEVRLGVWWEGTFNGYALALQAVPAAALSGLGEAARRLCPVEVVRRTAPRAEALPLALVAPGAWRLLRDEQGCLVELPFGAATGHFGAPGVIRVRE